MTRVQAIRWAISALILAVGAAAVAVALGPWDFTEFLFDTQLDAYPYRAGLIVGVVLAMAVVTFLPALGARRGRCIMALQALVFFSLFLNGIEVFTPFQLALGALMIAAIGFVALGRFEPKPPETRP